MRRDGAGTSNSEIWTTRVTGTTGPSQTSSTKWRQLQRPTPPCMTDPTVSTAQGVTTRRRSYLALVPGSPEPASCNLMTSKNYTTKSSPSGPAAKIRRKKTVILEARRRSRSLRPLRAPPGGIFSAAGRASRLNADQRLRKTLPTGVAMGLAGALLSRRRPEMP